MKIMRNIILTIGAFFFVLYLITPYSVFGASFNYEVINTTDTIQWDSAKLHIYRDGSLLSEITISKDTVLSLDDSYLWTIYKSDFWNGIGYYYPDPPVIIKSANVSEITDSVDARVTASHGLGAYTSSTGSGAVSIRVEATDTTGTDSVLTSDVSITVRKMGGVLDAVQITNTFGVANLTLPAESLIILGHKSGYTWYTDTVLISVADTIIVYSRDLWRPPIAPTDANLCNVYGYIQDRGVGLYGATITLTLPSHVYDSCNNTILVKKVFRDNTDTDGLFSLEVPKSSCLTKNKNSSLIKYSVEVTYKREKTKTTQLSIPSDSSTYRLVF